MNAGAHFWTPRELRALEVSASAERTLAELLTIVKRAPGARPGLTVHSIRHKVRELGLPYRVDRPYWYPEEDAFLRSMAGKAPLPMIVEMMAEQLGSRHTLKAIRRRRSQLGIADGIPSADEWLPTGDVARLLGIAQRSVIELMSAGHLRYESWDAQPWRWIRPEWVMDLVSQHSRRFDSALMPRGQYRSRVELLHRQDRWMTMDEVVRMHRVRTRTVAGAIAAGELQAIRCKVFGHQGSPRWWIRAADAVAWGRARQERKMAG